MRAEMVSEQRAILNGTHGRGTMAVSDALGA